MLAGVAITTGIKEIFSFPMKFLYKSHKITLRYIVINLNHFKYFVIDKFMFNSTLIKDQCIEN